jgi:hypothetical protein
MSRKALAIAAIVALSSVALAPSAISARGFGGSHFSTPQHFQTNQGANRVTSRTSARRNARSTADRRRYSRTGGHATRHPHRPGKLIATGGDRPPKRPPWHPRPRPHPHPPVIVVNPPGSPPVIDPVPPVVGGVPPGNNPPSLGGPPGGGNPPALRAGFDVPAADERRYRPNEVLLVAARSLDAIARRHRLTPLETYRSRATGRTYHRLHIDDGRAVPIVIRALAADTRIAAAQPNYLYALQDDVRRPAATDHLQYVIAKLHLDEAHQLTTGARVLVAVIDTGIGAHPYLTGAIAATFNAIGGEDTPSEHGTAMAGAIAEHGDLTGVAPRSRLLSARAFAPGSSSEATTLGIIKGLDWAIDQHARVINMSFAGPRDPSVEPSIAAAYRRGVVLVAAAGNNGAQSAPQFPAAYPQVIAVTATDADDKLFEHAVRGPHIAVAAPGVDVLAPTLSGGVEAVTGTSIAAAEVSGVAALLIELKPSLKPEDVRRILKASAFKLSARPDETGAGLVDAAAAIKALGPTATRGPEVSSQ